MGLPINKLIVATNENDILERVISTGEYKPEKVKPSISPSMDIQVASNFERLLFYVVGQDDKKVSLLMDNLTKKGFFKLDQNEIQEIKKDFEAVKIDDETTVTKISAHMVNAEPIGVYQQVGNKKWYKELPKNVKIYDSLDELKKSNSKAHLIISDKEIDDELSQESVIYRPESLVIGIGLHWDTTKDTIKEGIDYCLDKFLSLIHI